MTPAECPTDPGIESEPADLDYYRERDRFFRAFSPATEEERLLLTQMLRAWLHLQSVYQMKAELTAGSSMAQLFQTDLPRYQLLNRSITDAERMWRHAYEAFRRAHRGSTRTPPTPLRYDLIPPRPSYSGRTAGPREPTIPDFPAEANNHVRKRKFSS